jgi:YD repeat-containing protein
VFSHFDTGGKGWLAPDELGRLVEHFLPGGQVTPGDIKYFQVMVDRNQDGKITYEEFLEVRTRVCCRWAGGGVGGCGGF